MSGKKTGLILIGNEDNVNGGTLSAGQDEDQSFANELKTPTGQSSGQYITPTSNMNAAQTKKLGQNAPQQLNHH